MSAEALEKALRQFVYLDTDGKWRTSWRCDEDCSEVVGDLLKKPMTDMELATWIHDHFCHLNHTDGCSWHYNGSDKVWWWERAKLFRKKYGEERVKWLVEGGYAEWLRTEEFEIYKMLRSK